MVDQDASSPLSEPLDSTTPVPIAAAPIESDPPHASSRIADSVRPIASTSTANPQTQLESAKKLKSTRTRRKSTATMKRGTHEPTSGAADATAPDESCPACRPDANGKNKRAEMVWVECDACETWFHWPCVAPNPADSPDSIDKWYCEACLTASISNGTPLAISHKPDSTPPVPAQVASTSSTTSNVRKSGRATKSQIDYSNLHMHLPASVDRWSHVIAARKQSGQIKPDQFARKQPHELTTEWIHGPDGMLEPFVVETPDGLGMRMPKRDITVTEIADLIGPQTPLEVIDCASQSSLSNWTLGQWAQYYSSPDRDKVRNVISLEVSDTKLGKMVVAPELVRNLDWVDTIWPDDMKQPGQFPRVQKYCLMSVEKCWTDWHVDFAGSSVFYHVLKGGKTFYFIRPTPANLAAYERWSGSTERQEQEWLGDSCDEVLKIELKEGNTAFLPTGWIHAVYTPADSIVIGGNFLHSLNIPTQLRIYEIELATKVPKKFRYPHFVKLLWLVAIHYDYHLSRMTLPPTSDHPLPPTLSSRVLEGLFALSSFLINQTTRFIKSPTVSAERRKIARENVPWNKVVDPVKLSREFRKNVLRALGKELDADCFKPHGVEDDDATSSSGGVAANGKKGGVKRKGAEEPIPGPKSAKIRHASTTAGSPPPAGSLQNQGEIIARHAIPVAPSTRFEPRGDPKKPELGLRPAEVKDTRSSQVVVRRWEENGETFVETRTVHTIIERVRWTDIKQEDVSTAGARAPYQPYVVNSPALGLQNGYPPFNANGHHVHRVYPSQAGATASVFTPQYPPSYYPQNYPSQPAPIAANGSGAPSTGIAAVPHFPPSVYPAPSPSDRPTMTNHQSVPGQ